MKKVIVQQQHNNHPTTEIRAEKPMNTKPLILKEYFHAKTRMYLGVDGKKYNADAFDNYFNPAVKLKVLPERHKGKNADPTNHWQED